MRKISKAAIQMAEILAGLEFADSEREMMLDGLNGYLQKYQKLREMALDNSVAPAIQFNSGSPGMRLNRADKSIQMSEIQLSDNIPNPQELAFLPVTHLSQLIRSRKISSTELTLIYGDEGIPTSICFIGRFFGEAEIPALAKAYQDATDFHLKHPDLGEV